MIQKSRFTLRALAVAATLVIAALSMPAYAQTDEAGTGQVSIPDIVAPRLTAPKIAATASGDGYSGLITVHVDQTYCGTGGVQCPAFAVAGPTNRNPVRLGVQLAPGTSGVPTGSFAVVNPFVPAGGTAVVRRSCADCFQDGGNGIYAVFVEPAGVGNWKSGAYLVQVQVTVGGALIRSLVQLEIPF